MTQELRTELVDWLRIPSISTGEGDPADLERAAVWVVERVRTAGGEAEMVQIGAGAPLVVGEFRSARADAPTVLIYGHYDVQGAGALEMWTSPPFEPTIRGDRLYARGAADDKGNFLPLLHVVCELARDGALPVHIRVLCEGEEEVGSESARTWLRRDGRGADAAIVFDGDMADKVTAALTIGLRGLVQVHVVVRTAECDMHSGVYGGSVLNAVHALHRVLGAVLGGPDGRLREELRAGIESPPRAEAASWTRLRPGDEVLAEVGGRPLYSRAGLEYYFRNGADASLDVNCVVAGQPRAVIPASASATLTMRLAPHQVAADMERVLGRLLRDSAPDQAEVDIQSWGCDPVLYDADDPALRLAAAALTRASGRDPAVMRAGSSIPIVATMAARSIPAIVTGSTLPEDAYHAPNESIRLSSLELGTSTARELLRSLAALPSSQ